MTPQSQPNSVSLSERVRRRHNRLPPVIRTRTRRLWLSLIPIAQCSLAAGGAWALARLIGHEQPFFAPIAAVISLGLSLGQRWRRAVEMVGGVTVGIGVGDLLISGIGRGWWQISLVVALAMAVAVFIDGGPLVPMQAASSAVLVATLLPPGTSGGPNRMIDAAIGGAVGVLVVAMLPTHPVLRARRDAAAVLQTLREVVDEVALGLREHDRDALGEALDKARGTQQAIDTLRADIAGGREISSISPMYWASRHRMARIAAIADPIDNSVRNIRVMARRALGLVQDSGGVSDDVLELIEQLGDSIGVLRAMVLADPGDQPDQAEAARVLRKVARRATPELVAGAQLSETVILAQVRSALVDLLMVTGLKRTSAVATLR